VNDLPRRARSRPSLPVVRQNPHCGTILEQRKPVAPRWVRRLWRFRRSTLPFETDARDGFREPGFSEREAVGSTDHDQLAHRRFGFPLRVAAFDGNNAEAATMLPVINALEAVMLSPTSMPT
jgi:hypothetical protein